MDKWTIIEDDFALVLDPWLMAMDRNEVIIIHNNNRSIARVHSIKIELNERKKKKRMKIKAKTANKHLNVDE